MSEEDIIKIINGIPYYNYDYIGFLYNSLQEKDEDIKCLEKKLKDNIKFDENRFKELSEAKKQLQQKENIIKEVREYLDYIKEKQKVVGVYTKDIHKHILEILEKENK